MKTKTSLLTLGMIICLTGTLAAQDIGLQLYSLREQFKTDVPGSLDLIKSWGITRLEGGGTYGLTLEDFKKAIADRGLEMASVGTSFEELRDEPGKAIRNAKDFGVKYVMCAWIPHEDNVFDIAEAREAVTVFNKAGKKLRDAGITLAYHAHGYEFRPYDGGTLFDYMAEHADNFAFEMDVFWVQHGGVDPLALLNKYPDKFVLMHLKDMAAGVKSDDTGHEDVETNVVLGTGQVDIAGLVKRARELGIAYMFIEDESSSVVEQVPQSLKFLENLGD